MATRKKKIELAPATMSEADGVRYLHLGTPWVQGAMRVRKPHVLELEYIQRMMAWMLFRDEAAVTEGHAVQLGLGAAAMTRFCHRNLRMKTTAVELNPTVITACRLWFHLPEDDARLTVLNEDAAAFAADPARHGHGGRAQRRPVRDHDAASPVLDDEGFYRNCRALLTDGGVMTVNLFGRDASFERSASRLAAVFGAERCAACGPRKRATPSWWPGSKALQIWTGTRLPGVRKTLKLGSNCPPASGCA